MQYPIGARLTLEQVRENTQNQIDYYSAESMKNVWKHVFLVRPICNRGDELPMCEWLRDNCPYYDLHACVLGMNDPDVAFMFKMRWM